MASEKRGRFMGALLGRSDDPNGGGGGGFRRAIGLRRDAAPGAGPPADDGDDDEALSRNGSAGDEPPGGSPTGAAAGPGSPWRPGPNDGPRRFAEADLDGVFAEGPDLPDLGRVKLEEQNSKGSSGTSLLQRSFLISKELRVHGQITSDGGLAMDWDTVQEIEMELEEEGAFMHEESQEVLPLSGKMEGMSCRLPRNNMARKPLRPLQAVTSSAEEPGVPGEVVPKTIVMMVVGTRGDIQPFIGIALKLKEYGHRIRIATHKEYKPWIVDQGFEFFPLGGDPRVLSEFVCKHRGVVPKLSASSMKDVLAQSMQVDAIINSTWPAVSAPDPETGKAFDPDIIVANPPSFGHVHVAEKLGVPLHMVFTMPWTPTKFFPQPFARTDINMDHDANPNGAIRQAINWYSYFGVDRLQWMGMSSMITKFRKETLGFTGPMEKRHGAHALYYCKAPWSYIWSPSLAERPMDWPDFCRVVGFVNMDLQKIQSGFQPPADLKAFLEGGEPPVYIGFGSLVVDDPDRLTNYFVEATKATGLRALIQKGWGGLGSNLKTVPPGIFLIEQPVPHDWLFQNVCAVVHHGGAGTTAMGLYCGKPTFIVPFFGDQPFWGAACHKAGVGPAPVQIDKLNQKNVVDALKTLITPACRNAAKEMKERMLQEDGIQGTVDHIHETLFAWQGPDSPLEGAASNPSRKSSGLRSFIK